MDVGEFIYDMVVDGGVEPCSRCGVLPVATRTKADTFDIDYGQHGCGLESTTTVVRWRFMCGLCGVGYDEASSAKGALRRWNAGQRGV